jgi:hypothetical protein
MKKKRNYNNIPLLYSSLRRRGDPWTSEHDRSKRK